MTLFVVFSMLYVISTTMDYMHLLCFLYMLNYSVIYSLTEREGRGSGSKHTSNCVYFSKIEKSSEPPPRTCITSNPISLYGLLLAYAMLGLSFYKLRLNVHPAFFPLDFESAAIFFIILTRPAISMAGFP